MQDNSPDIVARLIPSIWKIEFGLNTLESLLDDLFTISLLIKVPLHFRASRLTHCCCDLPALCAFGPCYCIFVTAIVLRMSLSPWTMMLLFSFTLFGPNSSLSVFSVTKECMTHTFSPEHTNRQLLKRVFSSIYSSVSVLRKWGWCLCLLTAGMLSGIPGWKWKHNILLFFFQSFGRRFCSHWQYPIPTQS